MKTLKFMSFLMNFNQKEIESAFSHLGNKQHFMSKWKNAKGDNGSEKLLRVYYMLSESNKLILIKWVDENYKTR